MIDVIIPAYNAHDTIYKALSSILMQSCKDIIKVIVVNDNSSKDYSAIINNFNNYLDIIQINLDKKCGPGEARNIGIKNSSSEYIMFLDADDIFFDHYSVQNLYFSIKESHSDLVISDFYEEVSPFQFTTHHRKIIWNHGKIYRRSYIEKNNLYFSKQNSSEDLFFNFLFLATEPKYIFIDDITYIWQKNDNSITRINDYEFSHTGISGYNNNIYELTLELEKRKIKKHKIAKILFFGLLQMYYTSLIFEKNNEKDYYNNLLYETKKNASKYSDYSKYLKNSDKDELIFNELSIYSMDRDFYVTALPKRTFDEFIMEVSNYE